ncbi:MAG: helix-turn-helix domain-containing protein [Myxococcales bacterium]|nr:helix-turn-helix domain-containing protein [Myxococcales bacterium]
MELRDSQPMISVSEAAEALGVSESTLWRMLRRGEIKSVRRSGRRLVERASVERKAIRPKSEAPSGLTREHPIWRLVGAFKSEGVGPGSGDKHEVLGE